MNTRRVSSRVLVAIAVPLTALALTAPFAAAADQPDPGVSAVTGGTDDTTDFTDSTDVADLVDSAAPTPYYSAPVSTALPSVDGTDQGSVAVPKAASVDYYNCVLHPSAVHKRKSGNHNTVGAKPYTKCSSGTPSTIHQDSTLKKARWLGLSWQSIDHKTQTGHNTRTMQLKTVSWTCQNSNNSNFLQTTSGYATEAGHTFYSAVSTSKTKLTCGN